MCDPTTIAITGLILTVGSEALSAKGQNDQSNANKAAATKAAIEGSRDITLLEQQQQAVASQTIASADRQARQAKALASVSAGEAGVAGASVDALLNGIDRDLAALKTTTHQNLDMTIAQLEREKISGRTTAQNRIAEVPSVNPFAVGLRIGGAAASTYAQVKRQNTPQ